MSMLSQAFSIIVDHGISALVYGRKVLDCLNAIYKKLIFQLILTVQLPGGKQNETQMVINIGARTSGVSLTKEIQKHQSSVARKSGVIDKGKYKKPEIK